MKGTSSGSRGVQAFKHKSNIIIRIISAVFIASAFSCTHGSYQHLQITPFLQVSSFIKQTAANEPYRLQLSSLSLYSFVIYKTIQFQSPPLPSSCDKSVFAPSPWKKEYHHGASWKKPKFYHPLCQPYLTAALLTTPL
ncbi:hypothetical protein ACTXT7_008049 [Hymenolepis weldensis]